MSKQKNIFIGLAWPYANGSLHLGHVSAFLGGDILARFHRLAGNNVLLVSGSDCYGTPIAVEASELGIQPQEIAEKYHAEFRSNLIDGLGFSYDIYTRTTTDVHAKVVRDIFSDLLKKGLLYTKIQDALYSPLLGRFLPDRFVEGICPKCRKDGARGDQCDECGALLDPLELLEPRINPKILSRSADVATDDLSLERRESEHFYLKLSELEPKLLKWIEESGEAWRANARGSARAFLKQGLHDRAITRDTDWGVPLPIPGYDDKRIYVWFEAVIGYLSASKAWAEEKGSIDAWKEFWISDDAVHYYVHGKDNIPFHTIIWPAILLAKDGLHLPDRIVSSEYLTLEGKQLSKSRNWTVTLPDYLETFDPEALRYYLTLYGPESGDSDFSWSDYSEKVNGELVATFGNLINRTLTFAQKHFPEGVRFPKVLDDDSQMLLARAEESFKKVGNLIDEGSFRAALREVFDLAQLGNRYIHQKEPWLKIKEETARTDVEHTLAVLTYFMHSLSVLISPFLPRTSERVLAFIGVTLAEITWTYPSRRDLYVIADATPLFSKITEEQVETQRAKLGARHITPDKESAH